MISDQWIEINKPSDLIILRVAVSYKLLYVLLNYPLNWIYVFPTKHTKGDLILGYNCPGHECFLKLG